MRVPTIENNTFHDLAASVFNHLPAEVRNITEDLFYRFDLIRVDFVIQLRTTTFSSFIKIVIENNVKIQPGLKVKLSLIHVSIVYSNEI